MSMAGKNVAVLVEFNYEGAPAPPAHTAAPVTPQRSLTRWLALAG